MGRRLESDYPYRSVDYDRDKNLTQKYGLTLKAWNILFKGQGERCLICGTEEQRGKNWHTDHDHKTGKVRGILCGWCNTALGKFQESEEILMNAIQYLKDNK